MDLLEIRKKAKKAKVTDQPQKAPVLPESAPVQASGQEQVPVAAEPVQPKPAATSGAKLEEARRPEPAASPLGEISPESFEAFLQQSAATPAVPQAPADPPRDLDLHAMAQAFGEAPAQPSQGLDALFLDLAAEELYRHSYLTEEVEEGEQREVLSCMLADEQYGIDIHRIKEIIKIREITEVPRAPSFILGIITLRGRVIPVFDLRERLALDKRELGRDAKIVVVHHRDELYGLIVDAVIDVSRFPEASVEATPPVMAGVEAKYIEGIGRTSDEMIILLNLDEVLNLEAATAA